MKEKLIELLKLDKNATEEQIVAAVSKLQGAHNAAKENAETLEAKILHLTTEDRQPRAKVDPRVAQKMAAGLTFQQATEVVGSQDKADAEAAKEAKGKK